MHSSELPVLLSTCTHHTASGKSGICGNPGSFSPRRPKPAEAQPEGGTRSRRLPSFPSSLGPPKAGIRVLDEVGHAQRFAVIDKVLHEIVVGISFSHLFPHSMSKSWNATRKPTASNRGRNCYAEARTDRRGSHMVLKAPPRRRSRRVCRTSSRSRFSSALRFHS